MTNHEFIRMLFTAQQTARESVECALATSRQNDRRVEGFYRETIDVPPVKWDYGRKEADNAEDNN